MDVGAPLVADDETLLTYMRARYYDAASGRFISEDPEMSGSNYFIHCGNDPVNRSDQDGRKWKINQGYELTCAFFAATSQYFAVVCVMMLRVNDLPKAAEAAGISMACAAGALGVTDCPTFL